MNSDNSFWVALGAAAGATLVIVPAMVYFLGPRVEKSVMNCLRHNQAGIKELVSKMYKDELAELEDAREEVRRNAHSISGLRGIVTTHEEKLKVLGEIQPTLTRLTDSMVRLSNTMEYSLKDINEKLYAQGRETANMSGMLGQKLINNK